jgi:Family of unknown function (DUF5681)
MEVKMSLDDITKDDIANDSLSDGDQIGPGQPPKDHQFKKRVSGNPKGRPRKCPKSHDFLWDELRKPAKFASEGKVKQVPRLQIVYRQLQLLAMTGNTQALKLYSARREVILRRKNNYKDEEEQPVDFKWTEENEQLWRDLQKGEPDEDEADDEADESDTVEASSPSHAPTVDTPVIAQPVSGAETLSAASAENDQIPNKLSENHHG